MKTNDCIKEILIPSQEIHARIKQMAQQISEDYRNTTPLVVGVLKGSWIYTAELVRELSIDVEVDFIAASSYGSGTTTSGKVNVTKDITADCKGRDVLIVEDIVDSGITLSHIKQMLIDRGANSVEITTLLSKEARRVVQVDIKYIGFEIPDKFVIGYGMDFAEKFRGLKDVCVLKEEYYQ